MSLELLLAAAFLAGFFGSGHCFGMCGPVVVLLENQPSESERLRLLARRFLYNLGRLSFYVLLGVVAGASSVVLTKLAGADIALQALRILAALLVVALGLNLLWNTRLLTFLENRGAIVWKLLSPLAKYVLPITTPARALGAGLIWGALPCGLVYSAVAIAASSGNPMSGAAIMLAFWTGTLPALLLAGASARTLGNWTGKAEFRRVAGALLVIVGILALGLPFVHGSASTGEHHHTAAASQSKVLITLRKPNLWIQD